MTIEEKRIIRDMNLENNQYQGKDTIGRSLTTGLIVNPLIDSAVINSSAKRNADTFMGAINSGVYRNNTFFGGNTIFGNETFSDILPFVGDKLKNYRNNLGDGHMFSFFGDRFSFQRVGAKTQEHARATDEFAKAQGIKSGDDIIESGFGFSRNYNSFFGEAKRQGLDTASYTYVDEDAYKKSISNARTERQVKRTKGRFANGEYNKTVTLREAIDSGDEAMVKKVLSSHYDTLSQGSINKTIKSLENLGVDTSKIVTKRMVDKANIVSNAFDTADGKSIKKVFDGMSTKQMSRALNEMGIDNLEKFNFMNEDTIGGFAKAFKETSVYKELTKHSGKSLDGLNDELAEAVIGKFVRKTAFEKVMSNKAVQFMTGNVLSGVAGFGMNIAGAVVGGIAVAHSEAAINNFSDVMTGYAIKGEHTSNERSTIASYGHSGLSYSNDQDLYNILSSDNMADRYRKDIDPIDIDDRGGKLSDFLVY